MRRSSSRSTGHDDPAESVQMCSRLVEVMIIHFEIYVLPNVNLCVLYKERRIFIGELPISCQLHVEDSEQMLLELFTK